MSQDESSELTHRHTLNTSERPSEGVYSVIAAVEDVSPVELSPLAGTIDPDALDGLVSEASEHVRVSFEYCDYDVTVTTEEVHVHPCEGE